MSNSVYTEIILAGLLSQECSVTGNHGTTVFAFIKLLTLHSVLAYKNSNNNNNKKKNAQNQVLSFLEGWGYMGVPVWMCLFAPNVCVSNAFRCCLLRVPPVPACPITVLWVSLGHCMALKAVGALASPMLCWAVWQGAQAPIPPPRAG